jgi:hypothetical protein
MINVMIVMITTLQFQLEKAGRSENLDFQTVWGILRHGIMEGFSQKNKSCCHRGHIHICILDQTEMVCFFNALAPEAVG